MITQEIFERCAARAGLAPSVHNTQPARWKRDDDVISLFCDTDVGLAVADPAGRDAALSCGAALEGMILALSAESIAATATLTGNDTAYGQGLVAVARLELSKGAIDGLHAQLEHRFTWRGAFAADPPQLYGWTRPDTRFVLDIKNRSWLADLNDQASLQVLQNAGFRHELVHWMRLSDRHPRAGVDGMDRAALRLSVGQARAVPLTMLKFWGVLNTFGRTKSLMSERDVTLTAPVIALFHRDISENPVASGQVYLRLCLEAASLGLAGWPMAALTDHSITCAEVRDAFGIASDRRLVQVIRFGAPTDAAPPRARRPLREILC